MNNKYNGFELKTITNDRKNFQNIHLELLITIRTTKTKVIKSYIIKNLN